jgi:hypothetical protein
VLAAVVGGAGAVVGSGKAAEGVAWAWNWKEGGAAYIVEGGGRGDEQAGTTKRWPSADGWVKHSRFSLVIRAWKFALESCTLLS